ncbi:putative dipeptidyl-peptidase 5 precursor [Triangularia verruculosa]|uniref:Dipeptidyl-peptidase V n=1 Tax=Triangularia verruculosa TaxID=2587418 RepID=A0AAN6XE45_9PEZI|nr:putative dipeptidyl-peptidase 5 precursor [Triangularia verruculosa]
MGWYGYDDSEGQGQAGGLLTMRGSPPGKRYLDGEGAAPHLNSTSSCRRSRLSSPVTATATINTVFFVCFLFLLSLSSAVVSATPVSFSKSDFSNMTIMATRFTPEVMLSAPRRSAAVPNSNGTLALYTVSTYSFEEHKRKSEMRLLTIANGQSTVLVEGGAATEPDWVGEEEFVWLESKGEKGESELRWGDVKGNKGTVKVFEGPVGGLKVREVKPGNWVVGFTVVVTPEGKMYNPVTEEKGLSSGRVYEGLFVRHWDSWGSENRNSIWVGVLRRDEKGFKVEGVVDALRGSGLSSPVPPFGGTGDFDVGPGGLVFVAKDPGLDPAVYTKTDLYHVSLEDLAKGGVRPRVVETKGLEGYSQAPVWSNDGKKIAFTRMRSKQYESDKTRIMVVKDLNELKAEEFYATEDGEGGWDARPETILWSADDKTLYVTAEHRASNLIYQLPSSPSEAGKKLPSVVTTTDGSVSDVRLLGASVSPNSPVAGRLFVTSTSLIDNSCYSIVNPSKNTFNIVSSNSKLGKSFGLAPSSIGDITFKGAGNYDVQALVMKPSNFDPKKKYPLCFLIHGGPQGAWGNSWSTRWNPAVFAEQGYVVVSPNPTGSTGYGMALQNGIKGDWGGKPYNDLVNAFEYIQDNMDYVDTDRAVALGASYGGYMVNWIQGQPLGRKFKALVCHDGVFSTSNQWSTEELFFPIHDFEGTIYDNKQGYEKWDPANHLKEWATPELIIHSELDYRLPVTEGLAAFNVLQAKKVPSKLLVFPDENHWVLKPENSLVWHREVLGWINKYSGIEAENGTHVQAKAGAVKREVEERERQERESFANLVSQLAL